MRIVIDAYPAMLQKSGVGYYAHHLISEFRKLAAAGNRKNEYYLCDAVSGMFFYNMVKVDSDFSNAGRFLRVSEVRFPFVTLARILVFIRNKVAGASARLEDADIFFGTNYRGIFDKGLRNIITIHDMAYEYFPEALTDKALDYLKTHLPEVAQKADCLIADSEATKLDVVKHLNVAEEKVKVIYLGVDDKFKPINDSALLEKVRAHYRLPRKFILYVGTIEPRKNIQGLIKAYARLCEEDAFYHDLVIAGWMGWKSEGLTDLIKGLGIEHRLHFTGYIDENDLPALYNLTDLFAFPSFFEGFGLPVLEAMACGVPVVTSNVSSLPEVAGDAAVLVNPHSVDEIAGGMNRLLTDNDLRKSCSEKGIARSRLFTWEKCARETLAVFEEVMSLP